MPLYRPHTPDTRTFVRFVDRPLLCLETADYRTFVDPYGPGYPSAIGRIYETKPGGAGPGDSEHVMGHLKFISPRLPHGSDFPIEVKKEAINEPRGVVVLDAVIDYSKRNDVQAPRMQGKKLRLGVFVRDAMLDLIDRQRK